MKTVLKRSLWVLLSLFMLLIIALLAGKWWLWNTHSGIEFVLTQAQNQLPDNLKIGQTSGNLADGLTLTDISYTDPAADVSILQARLQTHLRLIPKPGLTIDSVQADGVTVALKATEDKPDEPDKPLPNLASPVPVTIKDLTVTNLDIFLPPSVDIATDSAADVVDTEQPLSAELPAKPLHIDRLQASLRYQQQLELDTLTIDGSGLQLALTGHANMSPPYAHQLDLNTQLQASDWIPAELDGLVLQAESEGSLDELDVQLVTSTIVPLQMQASLQNLLDNPAWDLQLKNTGETLQWPPVGDQNDTASPPLAVLRDLQLSSSGSLESGYQAKLNTAIDYPDTIRGNWLLQATGQQDSIRIEELTGALLAGSITAQGDIGFADPANPSADLDIQLQNIQPPAEVIEEVMADAAAEDNPILQLQGINGQIKVQLQDQVVNVAPLTLSVPQTSWHLTGTARYGLSDEQISAQFDWQNLTWPPQAKIRVAEVADNGEPAQSTQQAAQFASRKGQLSASGSMQNLNLQLQTDVQGVGLPDSQIQANASLIEQRLNLQPLTLNTLDGELKLTGSMNLDSQQWQADIETTGINPGLQWPAYPGLINFRASSTGQLASDQQAMQALLNIHELSGSLRQQPLSGNGEIRYQNGQILSDGLQLRSGDARLQLNAEPERAKAELHIPALNKLIAGSGGAVDFELDFQPARDDQNGWLQLDGKASELRWQDMQIGQLTLTGSSPLQPQALDAELKLNIEKLNIAQQPDIDSIGLNLSFNPQQHQLQLITKQAADSYQLTISGDPQQWSDLQSWDDILAKGWQGEISQLDINPAAYTSWHLLNPAPLTLTKEQQKLELLCIEPETSRADMTTQACVDASNQMDKASRGSLNFALSALPLTMIEEYLLLGVRSDQELSGQAEVQWDTARSQPLSALTAAMVLTEGQLKFLGSAAPPLQMSETRLSANLDDQDLLQTVLQTTIEENSVIDSQLHYGPLGRQNAELGGTVVLDIPSLSWLQKAVPELDTIEGQLALQAELQGPLTQPLIALDLNLSDAAFSYQPIGLNIQDIQLKGKNEPGQPLQATGQFVAGEGTANLDLLLRPVKGELELSIKGENLQLLQSDAMQLTTTLDLSTAVAPEGLQINGSIDIPTALIKPPQQTGSQVTESDDLVLVGVEEEETEEAEAMNINGELVIRLGDNVKVDAGVAETKLTGELNLRWENQQIPTANGEIQLVDGVVQAYGQTLDLKRSRVYYTNMPADNPRLSIRAVRDIFGDPRVSEAGVLVGGRAQEPDIRVFTNPATDEESALAYIATGNDFDHANGQGALNLGIYLLPRLFVSYGIGLFDNGNTANARYEFTDRWSLSVQSGARDTGVDLNWRKDAGKLPVPEPVPETTPAESDPSSN